MFQIHQTIKFPFIDPTLKAQYNIVPWECVLLSTPYKEIFDKEIYHIREFLISMQPLIG